RVEDKDLSKLLNEKESSDKNTIEKIIEKDKITEKTIKETANNNLESENDTTNISKDTEEKQAIKSDKGTLSAYPNYKINPKPNYPMIARRRGYEGNVLIKVWVLKSGKVGEMKLEKPSGYSMLDESALDAVKDWLFIPGKKNGVSVSSWVTIPITFKIKNS
ncbi:MAG: energy transducer TonB, partial [Thermodesulfobacteriota bacterium]